MKRIGILSIVVLLLASVVAFALQRPSDRRGRTDDADAIDGTPGQQWEYLVVQGGNVNFNPSGVIRKDPGAFARESVPLEQNLDKLGQKGWELVQITGNAADPTFVFKRRK